MSAAPRLALREVVLSKVRIERVLGEGGMAVVYGARHELLDVRVALKVLHPDFASDETVRRFFAEAKIAARIESPHVCRVLDVGLLDDDVGLPYILMEHLEGVTLEDHLLARGPLPVGEAVDYALHALEGLVHAHAAGVVHRDIKPKNLFLSLSPRRPATLKLIDFGISKTALLDGVTRVGSFLGSPTYVAPEQIVDPTATDARTDLWSLGVVLYECLTGRLPFDGVALDAVLHAILREPPAPLPPALPPQLAAIVQRCLSKAREGRPANALELAVALAPFAASPQGERLERIAMASGIELLASDPPFARTIPVATPVSGIHRAAATTRRLDYAYAPPPPALQAAAPVRSPYLPLLLAFLGAFLGTAAVIAMYLMRR